MRPKPGNSACPASVNPHHRAIAAPATLRAAMWARTSIGATSWATASSRSSQIRRPARRLARIAGPTAHQASARPSMGYNPAIITSRPAPSRMVKAHPVETWRANSANSGRFIATGRSPSSVRASSKSKALAWATVRRAPVTRAMG